MDPGLLGFSCAFTNKNRIGSTMETLLMSLKRLYHRLRDARVGWKRAQTIHAGENKQRNGCFSHEQEASLGNLPV